MKKNWLLWVSIAIALVAGGSGFAWFMQATEPQPVAPMPRVYNYMFGSSVISEVLDSGDYTAKSLPDGSWEVTTEAGVILPDHPKIIKLWGGMYLSLIHI